ncbi:hypothetical protein OH460_09005 [Vibrio sp. Makdt]|uniref:PRTRC system protein C n=1 Tax=Vibrio sp. Makdt TaxID=2998828 RepID=UPI0022CDAADE|nr:PRTRC system protein C [Vibrio sp. Makdt]MDA0152440.1 hypothetical protein [Vibrio sp. Makdt]
MKALQRKFQIGRIVLDDPDPTATVDQVRELHSNDYPMVRHTSIFEGDGVPEEVKGEMVLLYKYVLPPTKING